MSSADMIARITGDLQGQRAAPGDTPPENPPTEPEEEPQAPDSEETPQPDPNDQPSDEQVVDEPGTSEGDEPDSDPDRRELPRRAQRRIDKLTKRNRELEEQLRQAQAARAEVEIDETDPQPGESATSVTLPQADPLAGVTSFDQLDQVVNAAETIIDQIDRYRDEAMSEDELAAFESDLRKTGRWDETTNQPRKGSLGNLRVQARHIVRQAPTRRGWIAERGQGQAAARKLFPALFDRKSPEYSRAQQILKAVPALRNNPKWELVVGTYLRGEDVLRAQLNPKPNGKGQAAVNHPAAAPRVAPAPAAAPSPQAGKDAVDQQERVRATSGDSEAMVGVITKQLTKQKW